MKLFGKNSDYFFYFFALYSVAFMIFDYFGALGVFQIITYLGFLVFFCLRLNKYFGFILEHKEHAKKLKEKKGEKKLASLVGEAEENFKEGIVILLVVLVFFITITYTSSFLDSSSRQYIENTSQVSSFGKQQSYYPTKAMVQAEAEEINYLTTKNSEDKKETAGETVAIDKPTDTQQAESPLVEAPIEEKEEEKEVEVTPAKKTISPREIPGNLVKQPSGASLSLERNFSSQVKDVYSLEPFTKYGSDFFNILQLQRVLNKLGYYSGVADGAFNFETKLAIYNTLVYECNWPAETTKGVFGPKAKACIDDLYILVEDGESDGLIE